MQQLPEARCGTNLTGNLTWRPAAISHDARESATLVVIHSQGALDCEYPTPPHRRSCCRRRHCSPYQTLLCIHRSWLGCLYCSHHHSIHRVVPFVLLSPEASLQLLPARHFHSCYFLCRGIDLCIHQRDSQQLLSFKARIFNQIPFQNWELGAELRHLTREPVQTDCTKVVYLVRAQLDLMKSICSQIHHDTSKGIQRDYFLYFVPRRAVVCEKILEEEKVHHLLTIGEYPLYLLPLDDDVLYLVL
ncbi:PREDICTED: uncharacterized protein LOC109185177 [Ipomoea nil]|uniref:uncharacterized protein LOC109185177 n=1 Tax=Ipomoea nil TaxID=35883 RepID=UPI00090191C0|nr:PREDICTED: uncharacterized protein LOC109185177 [Ipomoea nil]